MRGRRGLRRAQAAADSGGLERSHRRGGRQPFLGRRTRLQILHVHFLRHFALIRRLLCKILRQYQMNRLSEIGNNLGGFPRRGTLKLARTNTSAKIAACTTSVPIAARQYRCESADSCQSSRKLGTGIRAWYHDGRMKDVNRALPLPVS